MKYDLSVVPCQSYDDCEVTTALNSAIDAIDGLSFVRPGVRVAIKANLVMTKRPEAAATTHPALVAALTRMLVERGAVVTVGDSPGGPYNAAWLSAIYSATGMRRVEEAGAKLNRDFTQKRGKTSEALVLKEFSYTGYLDDADFIIDFAKLKTHGMMGMTGAVKNMFGTIPGTTKPEYHCLYPKRENFADMLIDLYEYFKPRLTITDGVWGMEGNGPTAGTPRHIGVIIASESGYLSDLAGARIMGLPVSDAPVLDRAIKRGLCPESLDKVNVFGDVNSFVIRDFELIESGGEYDPAGVFPRSLRSVAKRAFRPKPVLTSEKCIGCAVCMNTCPKKAIRMNDDKKPVFDYKLCIRCFCCQEFCPRGAIEVKRTGLARILNG